MITFRTEESLQSGHKYKIAFKFTSILNDKLIGFYRSSYVENGVTKCVTLYDKKKNTINTSTQLFFNAIDIWLQPNLKQLKLVALSLALTNLT